MVDPGEPGGRCPRPQVDEARGQLAYRDGLGVELPKGNWVSLAAYPRWKAEVATPQFVQYLKGAIRLDQLGQALSERLDAGPLGSAGTTGRRGRAPRGPAPSPSTMTPRRDSEQDPLAERASACLAGAAVGDALGGATEGWESAEIRAHFGGWVEGIVQSIRRTLKLAKPFSPFHKGDGHVTDDTLMTHVLVEAYARKRDHLDAYDMERLSCPRSSTSRAGSRSSAARTSSTTGCSSPRSGSC